MTTDRVSNQVTSTNRVTGNLLANFAGQGWSVILAFAFIPLYIRFLGVEAYGLVGFYATLQGLFSILDLGLSTTINRELARYTGDPLSQTKPRDLLRTMEFIYWGIALLIGTFVIALSGPISRDWLSASQFTPSVVRGAVGSMGLLLAVQWPLSLYSGGLLGLQRQARLRGINAVFVTLRGVGAVLILWLIAPTIRAYFAWHILVMAAQVSAVAFALWRAIPDEGFTPRFNPNLIRRVWRFSIGMGSIQVVTILLTQLPAILLSKLLSLEVYGYYSIAQVVAGGLNYLISPIGDALFPSFSSLVARRDMTALASLYHWGCQVMSVVILPLAAIIAAFSPEIMVLWTGSALTAENTQGLVRILIVGTALNGIITLPYALQLSFGWTRLSFTANLIALVVLSPVIYLLTSRYGAIGAALFWLLLNTGYVLIIPHVMHTRVLRQEKVRWYLADTVGPLLGAFLVVVVFRLMFPVLPGGLFRIAIIGAIYVAAAAAAVIAAPGLRSDILIRVRRFVRNL